VKNPDITTGSLLQRAEKYTTEALNNPSTLAKLIPEFKAAVAPLSNSPPVLQMIQLSVYKPSEKAILIINRLSQSEDGMKKLGQIRVPPADVNNQEFSSILEKAILQSSH